MRKVYKHDDRQEKVKVDSRKNLVAVMSLGGRDANSVALHFCKTQVFQTQYKILETPRFKPSPPTTLRQEFNVRT